MAVRFWAKVDKREPDQCWSWLGTKTHSGTRGQIWYGETMIAATKASLILAGIEVPDGMCVLHRCDNPPCVNPSHLFLGTLGENNNDRTQKGRTARGEKSNKSTLTDSQVIELRSLFKLCKRGEKSKLAKQFGISFTTLNNIINRKTWSHL